MSKKFMKVLGLLLALVMVLGLLTACKSDKTDDTPVNTEDTQKDTPEDTTEPDPTEAPAPADDTSGDVQLPRNESMYFGGQQWGAVNGWNPMGDNNNNAMALS